MGWLSPIQKVMAEDYGMHLKAVKIYDWAKRLALPKKKGALLAPSSDP